jgi:hypothetical protein
VLWQLGVASMSRYEGHGADYIDGVRKRTPAVCCRLRLFELRRRACGSKESASRRFFYGTAEAVPLQDDRFLQRS